MRSDMTPEEAAAWQVFAAFHTFAASCITIYGADHPVSLIARRNAQRARYELIVGERADIAEVRDRVIAMLEARRQRIATLLS